MPISIPTFLSYLLLISSARAQVEVGTTNATQAGVSAPDCTDSTLAWVGSLRSDARFVSITIRFRIVLVFL